MEPIFLLLLRTRQLSGAILKFFLMEGMTHANTPKTVRLADKVLRFSFRFE